MGTELVVGAPNHRGQMRPCVLLYLPEGEDKPVGSTHSQAVTARGRGAWNLGPRIATRFRLGVVLNAQDVPRYSATRLLRDAHGR